VESGPIVAGFNNYVYVVLSSAGGTVLAYVVTSHPNTVQPLTSTTGGLAQAIADGLNEMNNHGKNIWMSLVDKHVVTTYTPGSAEYNRIQTQIDQIEHGYSDAKEKGTPTKNHDPNNPKENIDDDKSIRALEYKPYSSILLFGDATDKQNGCPKQIRYYGKDGKAELDIDFSHTPAWVNGKLQTFPHKQRWVNGVRSDNHEYDGIDKIIDNWKCKNYDYKNHIFKKGGL
jgi:hypothetical protein